MKILEANVDDIGLGGVYSLVRNIILNNSSDDVIDIASYERFENQNRIDELKRKGSSVYFIGYDGNKIVKQIHIFNRMRQLVQKGEYDCIHIHSDVANKLFVLGLAARCGGAKRIIMHSHASGVDGSNRLLKKIFHKTCRLLLPLISPEYMSCSDIATKWMFPYVNPNSVKVLNNGVNVENFAYNEDIRKAIRKELNINNEIIIGHIGRFAFQKNHEFLLNVYSKFRSEVAESKLLLVGVGDLMDEMRELADRLGISQSVIFYGASSRVNELFQAMDVFVLPSHFEGLPIVGVEAQASGLPVVFSDRISRESKIIDDVSFLPINSGSESLWVREIVNMSNVVRTDTSAKIESSGFSLINTIRTLILYYHKGKNDIHSNS